MKNKHMTGINQKNVLEAIKKEVQKWCPTTSQVEIQEIEKNNGVMKYGLMIQDKERNVSPLIYLESYLMEIEGGHPIEETAKSIYTIYQNHRKPDSDIATELLTADLVKDKIIYQLVSLERNKTALSNLPYRVIGEDLAVVFSVLLETDNQGMMTTKISKDCLKHWGMKEEELWNLANENTSKLLPVKLEPLVDVLLDLFQAQIEESGIELKEEEWKKLLDAHREAMDEKETLKLQMYVLSNRYKIGGATTILYPGVLMAAAEQLGEDLVILPSSIHEVILVRKEERMDYDAMAEMVKAINQKEVPKEDVLSDSVYLYCRKDSSFCRVSGSETD